MVDDRPQEVGSPPDPGRAKRPAPTIDLAATEISGPTSNAGTETPGAAAPSGPSQTASAAPSSASISPPISPWVVAPFSGAVAAALVIAVGWMLGWPAVQQGGPAVPPPNAAAIDDLSARVGNLEARIGKPATDAATAGRVDGLEKAFAALRSDVVALRAQSDKLAAGGTRPATGETAASIDLAPLDERIAQLERASRAVETEKSAAGKPADDLPLRRVVAAALLDVSIQQGHPFAALLATAKSLAANPDALKPLEPFASIGVPSVAMLNRELLTLVPKLNPPAESARPDAGIIDRLQAGAAKLVRIERTNGTGNDRGAIAARVTAAALRNDFADARRELKTLSPADRAPAQALLDKADARDAALAASRQFADEAMTALARPGQ